MRKLQNALVLLLLMLTTPVFGQWSSGGVADGKTTIGTAFDSVQVGNLNVSGTMAAAGKTVFSSASSILLPTALTFASSTDGHVLTSDGHGRVALEALPAASADTDSTLAAADGTPAKAWRVDIAGHLKPGADATYDIGDANERVRDIYLSSGIFLGGTSAVNELHDYEEGIFTPTFTFGNAETCTYGGRGGQYTKIGELVRISAKCSINDGSCAPEGSLHFSALPFTVVSIGQNQYSCSTPYKHADVNLNADEILSCQWVTNSTTAVINSVTYTAATTNVDVTGWGVQFIIGMGGTYETAN